MDGCDKSNSSFDFVFLLCLDDLHQCVKRDIQNRRERDTHRETHTHRERGMDEQCHITVDLMMAFLLVQIIDGRLEY
ncbi:hypothetical protein TSUD_357150 [Trifolium subterraneum]|uniref:Uncharacterized protein n=1 Tax=Trifolium subterraneum TaxID=3900 RepID=A0A2Z6MN91_TRISU|nr:hypothetical protein TSUD_357150 [Trifolium subterraneum]